LPVDTGEEPVELVDAVVVVVLGGVVTLMRVTKCGCSGR
jgi:hypothetical protein